MYTLTALASKLACHTVVDPAELGVLRELLGRPHVFDARRELPLVTEGEHRAWLIAEGWALTYKLLPTGARQVIDIAIAGDMIGFRELLLRNTDTNAAMVGPGVVHEFGIAMIEQLFRDTPALAGALMWASSRDEGLVVERLVDLGRRSAIERIAHFVLELEHRLRVVGLSRMCRFRCPLSQAVMADALGLTPIHVNRTLRELRSSGLLSWRDGSVAILDYARLAEIAGYDPTYLDGVPPASACG